MRKILRKVIYFLKPTAKRDFFDWLNLISTLLVSGIVVWLFLTLNSFELKNFTAQADINADLVLATSTIKVGPQRTEKLRIYIYPHNEGEYDTNRWQVLVFFTKHVDLFGRSEEWLEEDENRYTYRYIGNSYLLYKKYYIHKINDAIGWFDITLPSPKSDICKKELVIPMALIHSSAERMKPNLKLVSFDCQNIVFVENTDIEQAIDIMSKTGVATK